MICLPARLPRPVAACAAAALAVGTLAVSAPLAAQEEPGSYLLPSATPTPTPQPAGPADERAGVAIPPRPVPSAVPAASPATPRLLLPPEKIPQDVVLLPLPEIAPSRAPATPLPAPSAAGTAAGAAPEPSQPSISPETPAQPASIPSEPVSPALTTPDAALPADITGALPSWWPWAVGGAGGVIVLGTLALLLRRRRKPKVLRLAAPAPANANAAAAAAESSGAESSGAGLPRLDLTLEVTGATRSVMMFTLHYRLTLTNRTGHAANDLNLAVLLACARRGVDNAASPRAAQRLERIGRLGPHQSLVITGEVQLPLREIAVLRQGRLPLFIPLVHVTAEGEALTAVSRSFVIGTPSAAGTGRLHPISLDTPPGSISALQAQRVEIPAVSAAA